MGSTETNSNRSGLLHMRHPDLTSPMAGAAVCLALLLAGKPAEAQEFRFNAEPAVAFFVDQPQSDRFATPSYYFALRPGIALGRIVTLQWSYAALLAPAGEGYVKSGTAHFLLAGVLFRPFGALAPEDEQLGGLTADVNLGYVRTDQLDRFGFDAGLGYNFQVAPWFALGPVVRYGQVVQPDDIPDRDPNDAQFLTVGLNLAFGPAHKDKKAVECPACPECVQRGTDCPKEKVATGCPDYDRDGVCDADDLCPTKIGPPATLGCPIDPCSGAPLRVLVQFQFDSASLPAIKEDDPQTMDPVLDEVARAIAQDPSCRVCIVGNASEEGTDEYNLDLSDRRARAVQKYLSARGLPHNRIPTIGHGERCQIVPEASLQLNRRVDFRRLGEGESCPTDCIK